jgi:hypothetical protein
MTLYRKPRIFIHLALPGSKSNDCRISVATAAAQASSCGITANRTAGGSANQNPS